MAKQHIAHLAFACVIEGEFPAMMGGSALEASLAQAMVDEPHHTLMHLNGNAMPGISLTDTVLPRPYRAVARGTAGRLSTPPPKRSRTR
ncbi:hypothetical protein ACGFWI_28425 [Streptomyces sp. NPDC048434]|uniref:hypothetical protein n=1 Tax=Streptomyces sp. NPDC048434 TaxID=3365549 RepID=UPI0037134DC3